MFLPLDARRGADGHSPGACATPGTSDRLYPRARLRFGANLLPRIAARQLKPALGAHAAPRAGVVHALVRRGETAIRDVVDESRDLPTGHEFVAEIQRLPEQHVRSEAFAVGA